MASSNGCVVDTPVVLPEDDSVQNGSSQETANKAAKVTAASNQVKSANTKKRITGTVKWFNVKDGFGFITRHDTGEDVFVHQSCILRPNSRHSIRSVGEGEVVEFGVIASKVTGPGFQRVKGSSFVRPKSGGGRGGGGGGGRERRPKSGSSVRSNREDRRAPKSAPGTTRNSQAVGDGPIVKEMAQLKVKDKEEEENVPTEVAGRVDGPLAVEEIRIKEGAGEVNVDDTASVDSASTAATVESAN